MKKTTNSKVVIIPKPPVPATRGTSQTEIPEVQPASEETGSEPVEAENEPVEAGKDTCCCTKTDQPD